jgi:hypothetical protein
MKRVVRINGRGKGHDQRPPGPRRPCPGGGQGQQGRPDSSPLPPPTGLSRASAHSVGGDEAPTNVQRGVWGGSFMFPKGSRQPGGSSQGLAYHLLLTLPGHPAGRVQEAMGDRGGGLCVVPIRHGIGVSLGVMRLGAGRFLEWQGGKMPVRRGGSVKWSLATNPKAGTGLEAISSGRPIACPGRAAMTPMMAGEWSTWWTRFLPYAGPLLHRAWGLTLSSPSCQNDLHVMVLGACPVRSHWGIEGPVPFRRRRNPTRIADLGNPCRGNRKCCHRTWSFTCILVPSGPMQLKQARPAPGAGRPATTKGERRS